MQLLAATLILAPVAFAATLLERQSTCSKTHIFLAKGNNEPYPGRQGVLVNAICSGLDNCDYEDILFYNPVDSDYCRSVSEGVANGIAQITAYNARCPDSQLVISGYSQGAQIVGDILGGGGGTFFNGCQQTFNAGIDINSAAGKKIAATLVFGSTRHTAQQSYNVLSGGNENGIFPRTGAQLAGLAQYAGVFNDYCVASDPVCAGGDTVANHLNYFDIYTDEAANWVKSKLNSASSPSPSTTSAVSSSVALPSATPYSNGTMTTAVSGSTVTVSCIPTIPTVVTTVVVTVPCATVNTAALPFTSSLTASVTPVSVPYPTHTSAATSAYAPTGTGAVIAPTASGTVQFTGAAATTSSSLSFFGLVIAAGVLGFAF